MYIQETDQDMQVMSTRCVEMATACHHLQDGQIIFHILLGEADKKIRTLQQRAPAPPTPPRPVTSMACQTSIKVEPQDTIGPNVPIPEPSTGSTVTITTKEHFVFKGAVRNVNRLIVTQAKAKPELLEAKASGSQEMVQALAKTRAERDAFSKKVSARGKPWPT